jgi:hypothetical protein
MSGGREHHYWFFVGQVGNLPHDSYLFDNPNGSAGASPSRMLQGIQAVVPMAAYQEKKGLRGKGNLPPTGPLGYLKKRFKLLGYLYLAHVLWSPA